MMTKHYYFISGLPRSGSTLLSSILKQNPRFHAGVSSPLLPLFRSIFEAVNNNNSPNSLNFSADKKIKLLKSAVDIYYEDFNKEVIFDTNRIWTNLLPQLKAVFPYTKIILCVRDINRILDSFERLHQTNPLSISSVFPKDVDFNVYSRITSLMKDDGIVRIPYESIKASFAGMYGSMLMFCEYDILTKNPEGTMKAIYKFIDQPYFNHDFNNVEDSYDDYDDQLQLPNLHKVRKKVLYEEKQFLIPPDILNNYKDLEVWR